MFGIMAAKMWIGFLLCSLAILGSEGASLSSVGESNRSTGAALLFPRNKYKLIIDQDGGADDAMAILMSILYEKYFNGPKLIAVTTTHGNVNESQVFKNTQRILDVANRQDIPIYRGATRSLVKMSESDYFFGMDGLGDLENVNYQQIPAEDKHAVIALTEYSKIFKNELIIMAIGPLTNIALARRLDPEFESRLNQLYVGAGHIQSSFAPEPEFNALMDVEAYKITVDKSSPSLVTVVPYSQVLYYLNVSVEWRTDVLGVIPTKIIEALNSYERVSLPKEPTWSLLDPAVAAVVLDSRVVSEYKYSNNSIYLCGEDRGINTNDFESEEPNVRLVYSLKKEYYMKLLIGIFSAELK